MGKIAALGLLAVVLCINFFESDGHFGRGAHFGHGHGGFRFGHGHHGGVGFRFRHGHRSHGGFHFGHGHHGGVGFRFRHGHRGHGGFRFGYGHQGHFGFRFGHGHHFGHGHRVTGGGSGGVTEVNTPEGKECGPICRMGCLNGFVTDENGCPICKCKKLTKPAIVTEGGGNTIVTNGEGGGATESSLGTTETASGGFTVGGKFEIDMFGGTCPTGTKTVGDQCEITDTDLFLPWLKENAAKYGITYSYSETSGGDDSEVEEE